MNRWRIALPILMLLAATPVAAQTPHARPDDSWIVISGTVINPTAETFLLDYGEGTITVEVDDWDWYREGFNLLEGDEVMVHGRIDDDLFETSKIEASSVYVESMGSLFLASPADEEDAMAAVVGPIVASQTIVQGTVSAVNGREFTVSTGSGTLSVDTSQLPYNPMDDWGYPRLDVGDLVRVTGDMDYDLFESRELMADGVVELTRSDG